jgi:hypothetical protein
MEQALDLPEDPEALRLLVQALTREVQQLKAHQSNLQETIRLLLHNPTCSTKRKLMLRTAMMQKVPYQ